VKLDFVLALLQNFKCIAEAVLVIATVGGCAALFFAGMESLGDGGESCKKTLGVLKKVAPWLIPFVLIALVPSIDDIWKVRIGLIKLQLSSPENIAKGTEEITRIARKLECEYLGCKEEKK